MSREFKFRIYSFISKSFIYFDIYDYPQGIAGGVSEPQQFTGLKNSKGKEVYEGDIIEWGKLNYLIEWNHIAHKWQGRCPFYQRYHHPITESFRDLFNGSIVGNIFETPELIK